MRMAHVSDADIQRLVDTGSVDGDFRIRESAQRNINTPADPPDRQGFVAFA
jgi:hypothetical protein